MDFSMEQAFGGVGRAQRKRNTLDDPIPGSRAGSRLGHPDEQEFFVPRDQIIMGCGIALVSLLLLVRARWIAAETRKGQWLTTRFGPDRAVWIITGFGVVAIVFGIGLATGVIQPLRWE